MTQTNPELYTVGGTVQANDRGLYIARDADAELLRLCRESTFAYVLTPRQMGKSSLMIRTAERLMEEGAQVVIIDLTQVGTQVSAAEWYRGVLALMAEQLELTTNIAEWWEAQSHLGVTQRLTQFFQQVILREVAGAIAIFVDEIDTTLSLDFTDDFFAAIRFLYVARARQAEFRRLSFVLIGVATPGDLIRDAKRTPFNVGKRVDLTDFTLAEAMPLAAGLGLAGAEAKLVLSWVLARTGGHPYLTQRLCHEMAQVGGTIWAEIEVERLMRCTFLGVQSEQDNNLQFVRDMLTKRAPDLYEVLATYREIYRGKKPVFDEEQSLVKFHLKLSGIVRRRDAYLYISNRIYKEVFDNEWIREHIPNSLQVVTPQRVIFTSLVVTFMVLLMQQLGVLQPLELQVFDQIMQLRPSEANDPRIVIVTIDKAERERYGQNTANGRISLSDRNLSTLLTQLDQYQPRAIGLDLYRDFATAPEMTRQFRQNVHLVTVCKARYMKGDSIPPPPDTVSDRVGFSDFSTDPDGGLRRHLLAMTPNLIDPQSPCSAQQAFNLRLVSQYLQVQGIALAGNPDSQLRFGKTVLPRLQPRTSGYQPADDGGYQILLNYRATRNVATQIPLTKVLSGSLNPNLVRDRIVLIGRTDDPQDFWNTPIDPQMPGILAHAHMISQLLSAVLDGRSLLWSVPIWINALWILCWSCVGGIVAWFIKSWRTLGLCLSALLVILSFACYILLTVNGAWIALIPPAISLMLAGVSVMVAYIILQAQQKLKISKTLRDRLETVCTMRGENMTDVVARLIAEYIKENGLPSDKANSRSKSHKKPIDN